MNLLAHLNSDDLDLYAHLPRSVKDEAGEWFSMISELSLGGTGGCARAASAPPRSHVFKKHAARLGKSAAQCARKYYEWLNGNDLYTSGDWRILINRKKAGPRFYSSFSSRPSVNLPTEFLDHVRTLFGSNQRAKCETQHRELLRQLDRWRKGDPTAAIPGYTTPPPNDEAGFHPRGWSYRNLIRHRQSKVELAIETLGTAAAIKLLPHVPRTRVGVRFLEYVFFDDVWLDRKCIVPGYRDPARILQLGCLDHATGVYLKFGQRPELPSDGSSISGSSTRAASGGVERLKERDMKWLVAVLLEEYGYPADYDMHLIVERGTATLREPDARSLFDLSGGRIKVCRTSMEGKLVLAWEERSTGNPRGKGPLESWHNLLHNESACLPGQMGKDRDHCPAELFGREKEAVNLHTASLVLSADQRSRLRLPFPTKDEAHLQTIAIINRINSRSDHDLDGFDATLLWRIKGTQMEWRPESELTSLSAPGRGLGEVEHLLEYCSRKESPLERMARLSDGVRFNKFPPGELCRFYEDCHVLVKLKDQSPVIEFVKDGKKRRYIAGSTTRAASGGAASGGVGESTFLPPGEYLAYYRPGDMDRIHITRDGSYVATWSLEGKVSPGDTAALAQAIQRKSALLNHHVANVRRRHRGALEQREADLRNNEAILAEAGMIDSGGAAACGPSTPCATALQTAVAAHQAARQAATERDDAIDSVRVTEAMIRAGTSVDPEDE